MRKRKEGSLYCLGVLFCGSSWHLLLMHQAVATGDAARTPGQVLHSGLSKILPGEGATSLGLRFTVCDGHSDFSARESGSSK